MSKSALPPAARKVWAVVKRNGKRLHKSRPGRYIELAVAALVGYAVGRGQGAAVHASVVAAGLIFAGGFVLAVGVLTLIRTATRRNP